MIEMNELSETTPILIRYHEIALKGQNRNLFERLLAKNAALQIENFQGRKLKIKTTFLRGRILLECLWDARTQAALERTFGIGNFSPAGRVPTDWSEIEKKAVLLTEQVLKSNPAIQTFRVRIKRSDKVLGKTSVELDSLLGALLQKHFPHLKVDLKNPDWTLGLEIRKKESFFWYQKFSGPGGLPCGVHSPILCLNSGGIDSPVAALLLLRRGSPIEFVHFHGTPYIGSEILTKLQTLQIQVEKYSPFPLKLWIIPFGKIQEEIAQKAHSRLRTVLYRRLMMRIASRLASERRILAIATGESLGQVASQTLENLCVTDAASALPILRPLIGLDKDDIVVLAKKYDTFSVSTQEVMDCCTLFADRHPILYARLEEILEEEKKWNEEALIQEALNATYCLTLEGVSEPFRAKAPLLPETARLPKAEDQSTCERFYPYDPSNKTPDIQNSQNS